MKIVAINSSLRSNSNTSHLLDHVTANLRQRHEVKTITLSSLKIDCLGCDKCHEIPFHHNDELDAAYREMLAADLFIFATPTHFGMPSVLLKLLIDRSNPFWLKKEFKGKLGAIIVNGAGRLGGIELCAKTIQHYYYDCGMVTVPFYACFNRTVKHPEERLPMPLAVEITEPLDTLVAEIDGVAKKMFVG